MSTVPGMHVLYKIPVISSPKEKEVTFAETAKKMCINVASRVDAFFLKTPALLWVSLLQTAKIAIKFTVCVLTLNLSKHVCESWSFSGVLADAMFLYLISKKVAETAKVIVCGPTEKYKPSYEALPLLLAEVFCGEYHNDLVDSKGHGATFNQAYNTINRPRPAIDAPS